MAIKNFTSNVLVFFLHINVLKGSHTSGGYVYVYHAVGKLEQYTRTDRDTHTHTHTCCTVCSQRLDILLLVEDLILILILRRGSSSCWASERHHPLDRAAGRAHSWTVNRQATAWARAPPSQHNNNNNNNNKRRWMAVSVTLLVVHDVLQDVVVPHELHPQLGRHDYRGGDRLWLTAQNRRYYEVYRKRNKVKYCTCYLVSASPYLAMLMLMLTLIGKVK